MKNAETHKVNFFSLVRGIVVFLLITISLFHIFFDEYPEAEVNINDSHYDYLISSRDSIENLLLSQLDNNIISQKQYSEKLKFNKAYYKKEISLCNKEKRQILKDFSFNGRNSFHYWLFIFGLSCSFFSLAISFSYRVIVSHKNKYLKKSLVLESSAWIAVSLFWVIHSTFVVSDDLPTIVYACIMLAISFIIGVSIFYLIKYIVYKILHNKKSTEKLIELVADIKVDHYFKMAVKATTNQNKDTILDDAKELDKKIFSTLESIADEKE